jgi:carbonic anhydrase/acetyltransferase-like protein (isoleucine patch superfamily)
MPVLPYLQHVPQLGDEVRLADDAVVVGAVAVAGPARFASSAVARGDQSPISIGPRFYLGPSSTIHVEGWTGTRIGAGVWIGANAVVHGATVDDNVRVEDGGLVLSGSTVGPGSIVAANSIVAENTVFPENSYISGTPGRRERDTTPEERADTEGRLHSQVA